MPSRSTVPSARPAGRPRDPQTDERIMEATRVLLVEKGYDGLSYELVARRAGVTRPTIYRRWPTKAQLAYDAAFPAGDLQPIADTGDFQADLQRFAAGAARAYGRPETRAALPGLLPHFMPGSELVHGARNPLASAARTRFRAVVSAAIGRGQARTTLDADLLFDTIVGAVMFRVVYQDSWPRDAAARLAELLDGGARPR
jgi:AcrR family transcriptional regulator